ncbi:hypothetical protein [Methanobrevibacter sp.]|uniref:hypothetical protein n=1 Tax=Methanobrevibacter sp. TaxID=66852 RepID=UPI0026DF92F8|nr:hypothetical protein [Methanobrevibacter sp.]MDO5860400.1 hypothetical protein [Methanobrevibacter sp.]
MDFRKLLSEYHIVLIVSVLVLILYLAMIAATPSFSEDVVELDKFSIKLPSDANYNNISEGIEVTGPYQSYLSEIVVSNNSLNIFNEAQDRGNPSVSSFNDSHYLIKTHPEGLDSELDFKYFDYYDFIIPKKDYDSSKNELKNENTDLTIIKANYVETLDFLEKDFKLGG